MDKRTKHAAVFGLVGVLSACTMIGIDARPCNAAAVEPTSYSVRGGTAWIEFDMWTLEELGLEFVASGPDGAHVVEARAGFPLDPSSTLTVVPAEEARGWDIKGSIRTTGGLMLLGLDERAVVGNLVVARFEDGGWTVRDALDPQDKQRTVFELTSVLSDFSAVDENLRIVAEVAFAESWARELDFPQAAGTVIGVLTVDVELSPGERGTSTEVKDGRHRPTRSADAKDTGDAAGVIGPDIEIADLYRVLRNGRTGDITAYGVATNACNIGDERAIWIRTNNQHPVIMQNMYRLKDGRLEQIGMSWMKHGFYAVNGNACGPCLDRTGGQELGVGCSDPYSASLNSSQSNMSAPSDLNAHTGYFPFPGYRPPSDSTIGRRLQVHDADLDFSQNPDALYFVQGHYVTADDAAAGNDNNNASYRPVTVKARGICSGGSRPASGCHWNPDYGDRDCWDCVGGTYPGRLCTTDATCSGGGSCNMDGVCSLVTPYEYKVTVTGTTQRGQAAIRAWKDIDSSVLETDVQIPNEGLLILAASATDLGNGTWRYEYALENLNSHRSVGSFGVPIPTGALVTNIGFHDVDYHSGDPYDGTNWPTTLANGIITWSTEDFSENADANALRFGTVYNFRFDSNASPGIAEDTAVTIGLFRPGDPTAVYAQTVVPVDQCIVDCNENEICDLCDVDCTAIGCQEPCGGSDDCNENGVPDECEDDCNQNGVPDSCDIEGETSNDCQPNGIPDDCEEDCDGDGIPDECDPPADCDGDGVEDCLDLCPCSSEPGACMCPETDLCCWSAVCIPEFPRDACFAQGGVPACVLPPCTAGCMKPEEIDGDDDRDGDVDIKDCDSLYECFSGSLDEPGFVEPSTKCLARFDFDDNKAIDLIDYGEFYRRNTGP